MKYSIAYNVWVICQFRFHKLNRRRAAKLEDSRDLEDDLAKCAEILHKLIMHKWHACAAHFSGRTTPSIGDLSTHCMLLTEDGME